MKMINISLASKSNYFILLYFNLGLFIYSSFQLIFIIFHLRFFFVMFLFKLYPCCACRMYHCKAMC